MTILDDIALLKLLADGEWHSGEALAERFGVSRAAVWKRLRGLERLPGIDLQKLSGRGYRLNQPLELLDRERIRSYLSDRVEVHLHTLEVLLQTNSTNDRIRKLLPPRLHSGSAVLAEHQTAGRGRRGRQWVSPFGRNLYLSLAWRFDLPLSALSGLSLAAGVALGRSLSEAGLEKHRLKWPNDLLVEGRKMAGILVEASGEADGPCVAVIGVGLNLGLEAEWAEAIDQPWTDLHRHLPRPPGRNRLAGRLLEHLISACLQYQQQGLTPFLQEWRERDAFWNRPVVLRHSQGNEVHGICHGADDQGALLLACEGGLQRFHAGELSLRGENIE